VEKPLRSSCGIEVVKDDVNVVERDRMMMIVN
jgi:hypothetical protein